MEIYGNNTFQQDCVLEFIFSIDFMWRFENMEKTVENGNRLFYDFERGGSGLFGLGKGSLCGYSDLLITCNQRCVTLRFVDTKSLRNEI